MAVVLARNWWLMALRGLIAVIFGLLTLFYPGASLLVLVLFFGGFVLIDGIFAIIAGATAPAGSRRWGWLIVGGIAGVLIGIITFFLPQVTAFVLAIWIAVWAIIIGIAQIVSAVRLRKDIEGEFWLALGGALAFLFGVFALFSPFVAALAITYAIGFFAIFYGITLIIAAFRLRGWYSEARAGGDLA